MGTVVAAALPGTAAATAMASHGSSGSAASSGSGPGFGFAPTQRTHGGGVGINTEHRILARPRTQTEQRLLALRTRIKRHMCTALPTSGGSACQATQYHSSALAVLFSQYDHVCPPSVRMHWARAYDFLNRLHEAQTSEPLLVRAWWNVFSEEVEV